MYIAALKGFVCIYSIAFVRRHTSYQHSHTENKHYVIPQEIYWQATARQFVQHNKTPDGRQYQELKPSFR